MLADMALRDGHAVVAFDLFGDLDLRRRASRTVTPAELGGGGLTALVAAAAEQPARGVVYGASFENHPALVARLGRRHALLGNAPDTLRPVRDPQRLGAVLRDAGLPYPRTYGAGDAALGGARADRSLRMFGAGDAALGGARACRWLRKPLRGGGGTRVRDWRGSRLPRGTVVQERIDGLACSAAAAGDGADAVVLGVSEQLIGARAFGARGYRWCGNVAPPRLPAAERDALLGQARAICSRLAAAFALRGLFGVDLIWDGEHAWTIEVNPRPTASLEVLRADGLFDAHLRACAGELPRMPVADGRAAGKAVLFATQDVVVADTRRWLEHGVRDVPHPGERIPAGRPICTLVAADATPEGVVVGLEEQAAQLRAELGGVEVAARG
jgi:predicted ATP-grasp superfamily ATP-dependent carboligase